MLNEVQIKTASSGKGQVARFYNMTVQICSKSDSITRVENCFAIMFTNVGDTIARVNGMVIFPSTTPGSSLGDSRTIGGHLMDLYKGNISLAFNNPAGANPAVEIVQLFYAEDFSK